MQGKQLICILTTIYEKQENIKTIVQYENIIKILRQIDYTKYDVIINCNREEYHKEDDVNYASKYFSDFLSSNVQFKFFSWKDVIYKHPDISKFKDIESAYRQKKLHIGICQFILFDNYTEHNDYDHYIFWEDDILTTCKKFIYDSIPETFDIVLIKPFEYSVRWFWYKFYKHDLGKFEHNNGIHQLYCTYRLSNDTLKDIIINTEENHLYGHHENILSNVIKWLIDNKHYTVTTIDQEFPAQLILDVKTLFVNRKLNQIYNANKTYNNLIIHPIKNYDQVLNLLYERTF